MYIKQLRKRRTRRCRCERVCRWTHTQVCCIPSPKVERSTNAQLLLNCENLFVVVGDGGESIQQTGKLEVYTKKKKKKKKLDYGQ